MPYTEEQKILIQKLSSTTCHCGSRRHRGRVQHLTSPLIA